MKFKKDELVAQTVYLEGKYHENQLLLATSHSWFIEQIKNARPDLTVLKEYKKREQEFFNRAKDLELITAERDAQKAKYDGLRKQRLDEFMSGFNLISLKLKEMYQVC
jgi:structural maintenance of chromosome 4